MDHLIFNLYCKTNTTPGEPWLLNLLKQVFLWYIWLRWCNNGLSNMQCEAVEHWGDIKSDFVPLGVPRGGPRALMSCLEFCQTALSWEGRARRENVTLLHHKLHCEKQSSMSSMRRALFIKRVEQHSSSSSLSLSVFLFIWTQSAFPPFC